MKKLKSARPDALLCVTFFALAAVLMGGCKPRSEATLAAQPAVKPGALLFQDDFSQVPSGWGTWNQAEALVAYEQGGLRVKVNQPNFDFWSVAGRNIQDGKIAVDVRLLDGPRDNDFGILCRYQDAANFYMFLLSSDGYYGIGKVKEDQHSLIGIDQLQYTQLVRPDQTEYFLRAECVGDSLKFYLGDELLLEARDADFSQGDVGVLAGAYSTPGVDILFDNFEVRQP